MAKRFTDTNKYKKPFMRGLQGAYKLLWDYLYHDCDHAGIWVVDFFIAQHYIGEDMPVNKADALKYFNKGEKRIIVIDDGKKWYIPSFVEFQYGVLNESNRAHNSVIQILKKYNLYKSRIKPLSSPSQGRKDKDKDKDKDMIKDMNIKEEFTDIFLKWLYYKRARGESYKSIDSCQIAFNKLLKFSDGNPETAIEIVESSMGNNYAGFFEPKSDGFAKGQKIIKQDGKKRDY